MRVFQTLGMELHKRIPFVVARESESVSPIFQHVGSPESQPVLVLRLESSDTSAERSSTVEMILCDSCLQGHSLFLNSPRLDCLAENCSFEPPDQSLHEYGDEFNLPAELIMGADERVSPDVWPRIRSPDLFRHVGCVSVPDNVEEISRGQFIGCSSLYRVTFGASSSLKRIGNDAFVGSGLREIHIPASVEELCDGCFSMCTSLYRVTFQYPSSLKRIGDRVLDGSSLTEIHIPDSVEQIGGSCFGRAEQLCRVTFGALSSLRVIGPLAFNGCKMTKEIRIPNGVESLGASCFAHIPLSRITFDELSSLKLIDSGAFSACELKIIHIPDSVVYLGDSCFRFCNNLSRVIVGNSSSLKRIGCQCFAGTALVQFSLPPSLVFIGGGAFANCPLDEGLRENTHFTVTNDLVLSKDGRVCYSCFGRLQECAIPDSVEVICDKCFETVRLSRVTFGGSSSLKRIGKSAFCYSDLREIHLPDSIEELDDECFHLCSKLSVVTFGESPSLKRIGKSVFTYTRLTEIHIPASVEELGDECFSSVKGFVV